MNDLILKTFIIIFFRRKLQNEETFIDLIIKQKNIFI